MINIWTCDLCSGTYKNESPFVLSLKSKADRDGEFDPESERKILEKWVCESCVGKVFESIDDSINRIKQENENG
jgi:hypothetical protein